MFYQIIIYQIFITPKALIFFLIFYFYYKIYIFSYIL